MNTRSLPIVYVPTTTTRFGVFLLREIQASTANWTVSAWAGKSYLSLQYVVSRNKFEIFVCCSLECMDNSREARKSPVCKWFRPFGSSNKKTTCTTCKVWKKKPREPLKNKLRRDSDLLRATWREHYQHSRFPPSEEPEYCSKEREGWRWPNWR